MSLELAIASAPRQVRFWWRDDDAGRDDERLVPLLRLAQRRNVPIALAVVPEWLEAECHARILEADAATVLQHGIAHANHAAPLAKKIELGGEAGRERLLRELQRGRERLLDAFGERFVAALVPPWNRIASDLVPCLSAAGFTGISTFGARQSAEAAPDLHRVNTHLDLVVWREGSRPLTLHEATDRLAVLVRRHGDEPIGILSHHKVMDAAAFSTLDHLLALVQDQPQATLATAGALFGEGR